MNAHPRRDAAFAHDASLVLLGLVPMTALAPPGVLTDRLSEGALRVSATDGWPSPLPAPPRLLRWRPLPQR